MTQTNIIPFPDIRHAGHCGGCPVCGRNDGYLNLGPKHWFICREHKNKWLIGENLFDNWINQTSMQYRSSEKILNSYNEVAPAWYAEIDRKLSFPSD